MKRILLAYRERLLRRPVDSLSKIDLALQQPLWVCEGLTVERIFSPLLYQLSYLGLLAEDF